MDTKISSTFFLLTVLDLVFAALIYATDTLVSGALRPLSRISLIGLLVISVISAVAGLATYIYEAKHRETSKK